MSYTTEDLMPLLEMLPAKRNYERASFNSTIAEEGGVFTINTPEGVIAFSGDFWEAREYLLAEVHYWQNP